MIKFIGDAIEQFGVHNVYLNRVINVIHTKMAKAKKKDDCYHTLAVLHQQLGDNWKDVLTSPLSKAAKKTLDKKFKKNTNKPPAPGTYIQLRCTKKEDAPKPAGGEMEEYEEEVEEWVEVVPDAPAQAAPSQQAAPEQKAAEPVADQKEEAPPEPEPEKEPTPEPEPEPTPPPPPGPLISDKGGVKYRYDTYGYVVSSCSMSFLVVF